MPAVTPFRAAATAITSQHVSNTSPLLAPSVVAAFAAYWYKGELADGCKKITGASKSLSSSSIVACESNLPALPTLSISRSSRFGSHQPLHACSSTGAITRSPAWFIMIYCYSAYIGIVKNKDFPHFFRFHLMMGMLLETALQILLYTSNFFPLIHYNGRFGMCYWAGVGFAFPTLLYCCSASGLLLLAIMLTSLLLVMQHMFILCLTLEVTTDLSRFLSAEKRKIHRACMFRLEGLIQERTT